MDDKQLIAKLKSGDETAFNEIVERYSQKLYFLCLKMLQNEKDAEDTVQTVFLKAYLNISKFEEKSSISTWLYRIGVNVCTDVLRKRKKEQVTSLYATNSDGEEYLPQVPDERENVEKTVLEQERKAALYRAISLLKPKQKQFIVLRDIEGLSLASAAFALRSSMRFCASAAREDETYQTIPPAATARIATIATAPSMIILPMVICFLPSDAGVPTSPVSSAS